MLKVRNLFRDSMTWKFLEHDLNVNETVAAPVYQQNGCLYIARGKFGDFIIAISGSDAQRRLYQCTTLFTLV